MYTPEPVEQNTKAQSEIDRKISKIQDSLNHQSYFLANIREKKTAIQTERNLLLNHPLMRGKAKPDLSRLIDGHHEFCREKIGKHRRPISKN